MGVGVSQCRQGPPETETGPGTGFALARLFLKRRHPKGCSTEGATPMTVAVANAPPPRHPLRHFHHGVLRNGSSQGQMNRSIQLSSRSSARRRPRYTTFRRSLCTIWGHFTPHGRGTSYAPRFGCHEHGDQYRGWRRRRHAVAADRDTTHLHHTCGLTHLANRHDDPGTDRSTPTFLQSPPPSASR